MRVDGYGRVDRAHRVPFRFDGRDMAGFAGDTLTSALMANNVHLVARSFKYHRPRGTVALGSEEPNALVTIAGEPNLRATIAELFAGLAASSQNAWPSRRFDVMALNDLAAPFLGAGFYYKTFMWPKAFWEKLYEPVIRRAAGLGALPASADERPFEKAFAHCDLLVIGAGPAGLMAALTAGRAGADVILAEEDRAVGGRLLYEDEAVGGQPGWEWARGVAAELRDMPNVRVMTRTTVTGAYDQGTYGAVERVARHTSSTDAPVECFWRIVADHTVMATGALERPIAFANNDRPGILLAGAARGYLHRYGTVPGQRAVVFTNSDDGARTARDLAAAGIEVVANVDARDGAAVCGTSGRARLRGVTIRHADGREETVAADMLAVSGGWNPSVHLASHRGARPQWDEARAAFLPASGAEQGLHAAGAAQGHFATSACLASGVATARRVLELRGKAPDIPVAETNENRIVALWHVPGKGRAWLDFQNDVTTKDVALAARENFSSVEHMKRYTTQGMAPDQGKNSNVNALAVLADATGRGIADTGTTTYRPPYVPVALAAIGSGGAGKGFAPTRLTTSHQSCLDLGAPMVEAGLWYRPSYYPQKGDKDWQQACDREVNMVRSTVGICDVSTLGKIELQGPDAGAFLDFVYANRMSVLKEGRVKYGLMLREDGHVMDDGTVARLGPRHFLITTTTAAAGQVMQHLEFVQQVLQPAMRLRFTSTTEEWAQFAVAGPKSRDLLNTLLDDPISSESFSYMACAPVTLGGVAGRLFRISFSGEHAYELAVPARYGTDLNNRLLQAAQGFGGGPYGMEALNVLRIEKGFLTHAELHGRTTPGDLGLGRMLADKEFVGRAALRRDGLQDTGREQLVGLKPVDPKGKFLSGAHLFAAGQKATRPNSAGYITSAAYSATLGHAIALGFFRDGRARMGETVQMVDHLRGVTTEAQLCSPVFFDPDGGRLRG